MTNRKILCISSVRDFFCIIVAVATASVLVTYHISRQVPTQGQPPELSILFQGHVNVYNPANNGKRRNLESIRSLEGSDGGGPYHRRHPRNKPLSPVIMQTLLQIEQKQLNRPSNTILLITDECTESATSVEPYTAAFTKAGYSVHKVKVIQTASTSSSSSDIQSILSLPSPHLSLAPSPHGKNLTTMSCICLSKQCLIVNQPHKIYLCDHSQRVNYIPSINNLLVNKTGFCETMKRVQYIPVFKRSNLAPSCFNLPSEAEEFIHSAASMGSSVGWVLKPPPSPGHPLQVLHITNPKNINRLKSLLNREMVVQQLVGNHLLVYGMPFTLTVYVLVTSLSPLRAYIYQEATVQFRYPQHRHFMKVPGHRWSLSQLSSHIQGVYGAEAADVMLANMDSVLVQTLLATEAVAAQTLQEQMCYSPKNFFQMLAVDLIFNSSFHPIVTDMSLLPDLPGFSAGLLDDTISLLFGSSSVSADVSRVLHDFSHKVTIQREGCTDGERLCLTDEDLNYLLSLRREMNIQGNFRMLYPTVEGDKYSALLGELQKYMFRPGRGAKDETRCHSSADLHPLLVAVVRYFLAEDNFSDDTYDDIALSMRNEDIPLVQNIYFNLSGIKDDLRKPTCSEDEETMPYLSKIFTDPVLTLTPTFDPKVLDYYATVPYTTLLVKLWAYAQSCNSEARLENKNGLSRPSNFTLGLGENRLQVLIVDIRHTEPWVLSTYTVHVYRQDQISSNVSFDPGGGHAVCSLKQSCDLQFLPGEPCGLQLTHFSSWKQLQTAVAKLPACTAGHEQGEWLVPCQDCRQADSCHWSKAEWQPHSCRHPVIPRQQLRHCLKHKQVLFIGDSTNRGIMNYLVEQVNDTLTEWDKTHDIKVYRNINHGQTAVSFAYYPQFWLSDQERPVFEKAFYQLMKRMWPLANSKKTVIVVGGVHWLATHHLGVLKEVLNREGLTDVRLVMKSLGAGFHQQVDGLHHLTLWEQKKLLQHNQELLEYARAQGFHLVDTFNITMARYQHFLQGKCACHFHRVREILPSFTELQRRLSKGGTMPYKPIDVPVQYHVEGRINQIYSEILINRICDYVG